MAAFFGGTVYDTEARAYRGGIPAALAEAGLSTVRAHQPKRVSDVDYVMGQSAGRGMGSYLVVEIPEDVEIRRAIPAQTGRKRVTYTVQLHLFHLAHEQHAEDAEADVNNMIEAIKAQIHSDVTLGGICYQAGENAYGIRTRVSGSTLVQNEVIGTYTRISLQAEVEIIA